MIPCSAVATWLASKPIGYAALVLDGDCFMVSRVSLNRWLQSEDDADLIFYERVRAHLLWSSVYCHLHVSLSLTFKTNNAGLEL